MLKSSSLVMLLASVMCSAPASASAQSLYAGLLGGYAATTSDNPYDVEPYGVGGGASAGLALPITPVYLGARIVWYVGDSASIGADGASLKLESHYLLYGVDLGYDAELGPIVLRPSVSIGRATLYNGGSAVGVTVSANDSSLYIAPGAGLIVKLGLLYVGAEVRYNALTESKHFDSLSLLASLGVTI